MFNTALSKEIFQELMNGKIINKHRLDNAANLVENELFTEILQNLNDYRTQYEMSGYEFELSESFVFIRKDGFDTKSLKTDATMRAYLLLVIIAKFLNDHNYRFSKLTDSDAGISDADIAKMASTSDTEELMEKAGLKGGLLNNIKNVLVKRNIMLEKPSSNSYILSDAGKAFFQELIGLNISLTHGT